MNNLPIRWRFRLRAGLLMGVLSLGLNTAPVNAWDAGIKGCKHTECLDGTYQGYGSGWSGNTHLWLVNRAIEQLSAMGGAGKMIAARMNEPSCRTQWENGLWETDDTWTDASSYPGSHFYNPLKKWWDGTSTTNANTYLIAGTDQGWYWETGDAKQQAGSRVTVSGALFTAGQCFHLGRALHYLTDMTQPMHTGAFSGASTPTGLHPVWELYVVPLAKSLTPTAWDNRFVTDPSCNGAAMTYGVWSGNEYANTYYRPSTNIEFARQSRVAGATNTCSPDEVFELVARRSSSMWSKKLYNELTVGDGCTYTIFPANDGNSYNFTGACFRARPSSDIIAKQILADAVPSVTAYLYSMRHMIAAVRQTAGCKAEVWGLGSVLNPATGAYPLMKLVSDKWEYQNRDAKLLAVGGPTCEVWTADKDGKVSGPTGGKTVLATAKALAIGGNGDVWMIDAASKPAKLNRTDMQFYEPTNPVPVEKIAVSPTGVLYMVSPGNLVHKRQGDGWVNTGATALIDDWSQSISFKPDGSLWAIGTVARDQDFIWGTDSVDSQGPSNLYEANWNIQNMSTNGSWAVFPTAAARSIDAGGNAPLAITKNGTVWKFDGANWVLVPWIYTN